MARKTAADRKLAPLVDSADEPAPAPKAVAPNTVEVAYYQGGKRTVLFTGASTEGAKFTFMDLPPDAGEIGFEVTATPGVTNVLGGTEVEISAAAGGRVEVRNRGQLNCYQPCAHLNAWYADGKVQGAVHVTKFIGLNRSAPKGQPIVLGPDAKVGAETTHDKAPLITGDVDEHGLPVN